MNEMRVIINHPNYFLEHIEWNKDEFKAEVSRLLKDYETAVYSDDQIDIMKKDRATLNAAKKAISDRRIEIKKAVMRPYDLFEEEVKEITNQIDEVVGKIDERVKGLEAEKKAKKRESLETYFVEIADDLGPDIAFEKVFDSKWLNATVSLSKATKEINELVENIRNNLKVIDEMDEEDRVVAKSTYLRTLKMDQATSEVYRQRHFREEERKKAEEAEKAKEKAEEKTDEQKAAEKEPDEGPVEPVQKPEKIYRSEVSIRALGSEGFGLFNYLKNNRICYEATVHMNLTGTKEQLLSFADWLKANNYQYEAPKKERT